MFDTAEDQPGTVAVAVLGEDAWRTRYNADPSLLGRSILVNGTPAVVLGIARERSGFPSRAQVWLPLSHMPSIAPEKRDARNLRVFGRVRDGFRTADARAEAESIVATIARNHPDTSRDLRARVVPITERYLGRPTDPAWLAFITAGFLVLAVSCANVANLMLARAGLRAREIAI